ncbi:GNAT family N-acetyltransferase [Chengkuizengella axinellae]|uniref:GNAT family N-acetyltransferase n=1 Tax=Chengkuizengella axinellae TaxID=3064388 RepID=A0ABT9J0Y9_9BACL|nr:GNAT family N-acetyltransferase [Chengkuizengella sp. 2205SS18-9]MDP5275291.1 GNAT family N-acetyltransferase [Chengkuizengella sp. 2205SS18-9]
MEKEYFFKQAFTLENQRTKLVPFSDQYYDGLSKIIFETANRKYVVGQIFSEEDLRKYIRSTLKEKVNHQSYPFIIIDKRTNEIAGSTRFGHINFVNKRLEIGWTWIGEKFRGTGLNQACKFELLQFAFEEMCFRRVQFSADIDNVRSQKAIQKLGAKKEGVFRDNYINAVGESRDDVYFSIIASEWEEIKYNYFSEFSEHN